MKSPTLVVDNLKTTLTSSMGDVHVVDGISFSLLPGKIMGLIGESGSGKSMTAYTIMRLIDNPGAVISGRVLLNGIDMQQIDESEMRRLRGNKIAMIFQDPMMTLNPTLRIDTQMMEAVLAHQNVTKVVARELARQALIAVGIPSPDERLRCYPYQLSGGMRQRVAIAIAFLNKPDLIIADEPTTALDVTIQSQILFYVQKICRESGTSLIWITHDLSVVAALADFIAVMYAGKIVEQGTIDDVLNRPLHPYTRGLMSSIPSLHVRGQSLPQISGSAPALYKLPSGCAFRERCAYADDACIQIPPRIDLHGHEASCFRIMNGPVFHDSGETKNTSAL